MCNIHLKPYHIMVVHKIHLIDTHQYVYYCEQLLKSLSEKLVDPLYYFMFHLIGYMNSQNSQYWATHNLYLVYKEPLTHMPSWKWTSWQKLQSLKGANTSSYQGSAEDMRSNVWMWMDGWMDGTLSISYSWLILVTLKCCTTCIFIRLLLLLFKHGAWNENLGKE